MTGRRGDAVASGGSSGTDDHVSGAELLRRALVDEGVEVVFGHPGGAILPFYDALHAGDGPRHVLVRHEQSAAHAADGWARASGGVGVCVATSGPGATNLITGLATAAMDGIPLVAVTGQVPVAAIGSDAFQETDVLGLTMPVTKHGFLVERPEDIQATIAEAFRIARSGRPGPVVVDVPKNVQIARIPLPAAAGRAEGATGTEKAEGEDRAPHRVCRGTSLVDGRPAALEAAVQAAADRLLGARRPVLMIGRGVVASDTREVAVELAESANLPVVTTLLGLDGFPRDHRLALGLPGMHGTERANQAIQASDLLVGLGLRFDDRVTADPAAFAPDAGILHFDIDPRSHGRTLDPEVAVLGDLRETLPAFARRVAGAYRTPDEWWDRLGSWEREAEPACDSTCGPLSGRHVSRALADAIRRDRGIVVTDVGQHQMWIAQELREAAPRTHLTSGGLGTMGYALPAALGAALARPDVPVWAVAGDGGFQMTLQELATVVQERIPLRIVVVNNGALGMVRQWQGRVFGGRFAASALSGPDLPRLAQAYGIAGEAVERREDLADALRRAAGTPGPVLLDLRIPPEDEVMPMVRPGGALHDVWTAASGLEPAGQ